MTNGGLDWNSGLGNRVGDIALMTTCIKQLHASYMLTTRWLHAGYMLTTC